MSSDRTAALALITGSLAGLVTMTLHPTGADVVNNASAGAANTLVTAVHVLALLGQPLLLAGTLALTLRLRTRRDVAIGAYAFFALASVAVIIAAVASGFLAPGVLQGLADADEPTRAMMMNTLHYTGLVNQAFAKVHVIFSAMAILLWSVAILSGRELARPPAWYGLVLSVALIAGIATGHLRLNVHGFGMVIVGEAVWLIWLAILLWRVADD